MVCLKSFILTKEMRAGSEVVIVNFRPELKEIVKETKYLDRIGFKLPEIALNIALQVGEYASAKKNAYPNRRTNITALWIKSTKC